MIVHVVDIRESGPDGLIAVLAPCEPQRSLEVEADGCGGWDCVVQKCPSVRPWGGAVALHRRHSRREREDVFLCAGHIKDHREGKPLRLVLESNR